jgi:hypothetical protein
MPFLPSPITGEQLAALALSGWQLKTSSFTAEPNGKYIIEGEAKTVTTTWTTDGDSCQLYQRGGTTLTITNTGNSPIQIIGTAEESTFMLSYNGTALDVSQYRDNAAYATAAQGVLAGTAVQPADIAASFPIPVADSTARDAITPIAGDRLYQLDTDTMYEPIEAVEAVADWTNTTAKDITCSKQLWFNVDETKAFLATATDIEQYTLTTAGVPEDGMTLDTGSNTFANMRDFQMTPDGTRAYMVGSDQDAILTYTLTVAGSINDGVTLSATTNMDATLGAVSRIHTVRWNTDGSKMLIAWDTTSQCTISELSLATPYILESSTTAADYIVATVSGFQSIGAVYLTPTVVAHVKSDSVVRTLDISSGIAAATLISSATKTPPANFTGSLNGSVYLLNSGVLYISAAGSAPDAIAWENVVSNSWVAVTHTHLSADVTDSTKLATANVIAKRGASGEASFGSISATVDALTGTSQTRAGVYGLTATDSGVLGEASSTGTGVSGFSSAGNHADFGNGKFVVANNGNITATGTIDGRDVAADGALLDTAVQPADISVTPQTLTDAATIAVDVALGSNMVVTSTQIATLGAFTNAVAGDSGMLTHIQGGAGGFSLALDASQVDMNGSLADITALATGEVAKIGWETHDAITFYLYIVTQP